MQYIALLRGINVGGNHRMEMKKLKALFESLGFQNVSTYINSGNVLFEGSGKPTDICQTLEAHFKKSFGFAVPTLVKTKKEMEKIAKAIPPDWKNDTQARTDVAFLFPEIDTKKILDALPMKKEFMDIRLVKGALFWNVARKNVAKSHLNKLIGHALYKGMTIRNVNTVRYLSNSK